MCCTYAEFQGEIGGNPEILESLTLQDQPFLSFIENSFGDLKWCKIFINFLLEA